MAITFSPVRDWLPPGKRAAVCFTIDDVHPGTSAGHYDGGGDLGAGALGHVQWLLERHPSLHVTLFTTADWREISPSPSRILSRIPVVRDHLYLSKVLPPGTRRIDRHPAFIAYLEQLPRTEVACHGLHHIHPGRLLHVEFQDESVTVQRGKLQRMIEIFDATKLPYARGMCPPGWNAPASLISAMDALKFEFIASARDIKTDVTREATTAMSGLRGASLIYPSRIDGTSLVHMASNFQATSVWERARAIIECGGLLAIKAHIIKDAMGYVALDGMDALYRNYLDLVFEKLAHEFGESLWWTTMGQVSQRIRQSSQGRAS